MTKSVLVADIGGTFVRCAIVDATGAIAVEARHELKLSQQESDMHTVVRTISALFKNYLQQHPHITAIGIGFPGFFMRKQGLLLASPNLPLLKNIPLATMLTEQLQRPVTIENDALCAALGEQRFGAGQGASHLLHITLGTGVGGGLIFAGEPFAGEHGMAAEFGHLPSGFAFNQPCGCSKMDCIESYASATAIRNRYLQQQSTPLEAHEIYQLAKQGEPFARQLFDDAGVALGRGIASAVNMLDLRTVTISGGLIAAWDLLYPSISAALEENLIPPHREKVAISPSILKDQAGLLGAAALVL
ncbi:MAG: ROK family protein [Zetaproteobacteria bacterium]|nr:ROK family protein [Zetaproteobacteria bacterium]